MEDMKNVTEETPSNVTRRNFIKGVIAAGAAVSSANYLFRSNAIGQEASAPGSVERLMTLIAQDKKVARGSLTFILVRGIGEAFVARDVPPNEVAAFLEERLKT